jgi:hypothetical protein
MNSKVLKGAIAVFIWIAVWEFLVNAIFLMGDYQATAHLWRAEGDMKMWIFYLIYIIVSYFLSMIFAKGYEGNGVPEGLRFGLYIGVLMAIPMAYGSYAAMPIPYTLALKWFLFGLVEYVVAGIVLAMVYGKTPMVTKAAA